MNLVCSSSSEYCKTSPGFDQLNWILLFRREQTARSFQNEVEVQGRNSGNSDAAAPRGAEHPQLAVLLPEMEECVRWDAAPGLSLSLLSSRPAMPNTVVLWSPCLFTGFWNWPLRLTLSGALPWGALINLPISPRKDCNIPRDLKRKLSTVVAKETAETKWNGLLTVPLATPRHSPKISYKPNAILRVSDNKWIKHSGEKGKK